MAEAKHPELWDEASDSGDRPLAAADERVFEVHPEVSFRELLGRQLASKRTAAGALERQLALEGEGITLPDLPYPQEDVLDATVAAWTAMRYAQGNPCHYPSVLGAG